MSSGDKKQFNWSSDHMKLIYLLLAVVFVWSVGWLLIHLFLTSAVKGTESSAELRGLFGDQFGAINALFSGLAFAGIIFSIFLQNQELKQTKQSLVEQSRASNRQRFDSTFFKLLELHGEITRNLQGNKGREAFQILNERVVCADDDFGAFCGYRKLDRNQIMDIKNGKAISAEVKLLLKEDDISNIESRLEHGISSCEIFLDSTLDMHETKIRSAYIKVAAEYIDDFSHYFRNLYHLLRFINDTDLIEDEEKSSYAKTVRSQLSEQELVALLYNSISKMRLPGRDSMELGCPKMGHLLLRFDILQNLSKRSVIHPIHHEIFYTNNKDK